MTPTTTLAAVPAFFSQVTLTHGAALPVFAAFLALQLYLYLSHRTAVARQRRTLNSLWQQRRAPERDLAQDKADRQWLGWVAARFHDGAFQDGHYRREDALAQLDNWLEGHGSYLFLQRTFIMAPLIGLLITVIGFFFLQPATSDSADLKQILYALSPLVLGVGTGAALALFNQLLLHLAGKGTESVRTAAYRWFDDCVWKYVQAKPHVAANDAADALQTMAETIRTSIGDYRGATAAINQTCQSLQAVGSAAVSATDRLQSQMAAISDQMKELQTSTKNVVNVANGIVPAVETVTAELAESVRAFKSVIEVPLGQAATRHQASAELFASSVEQIRESAAQLNTQFDSFGQIVKAQATAGREWSRSLQDDVLPAQRSFRQAGTQLTDAANGFAATQQAFREAADSMQRSANGLAAFVRDGVGPATHRLAELDQILTRVPEANLAVQQITQLSPEFADLVRSLAQAAAAAEAIRSLPEQIRAVLQAVVSGHNGNPRPSRLPFLRFFGFGHRSNRGS